MPDSERSAYAASPPLHLSQSSAGFTLIEIAVVLAIIGLVMLLVMPRLPSSEREDLKISARTLASTLRYVQDRAAASSTAYFLSVVPGTDRVAFREVAADGSEKEPADPQLQKQPIREGIQVADVMIPRLGTINDGQVKLDMGVGGLRDLTIIHLRSPGGTFWTVMAFPASRKVKVYEGYQETPP